MRQYIGARYVPTYYKNSLDPDSTEWESNVSYEPLTIVTLPNQHSYISKQFVPATVGTPAENGAYWLDQGSESAYIEVLQQEIDDMKDGDVEGSLQAQINTLAASDPYEKFRDKTICVIGDSISSYEQLANNWVKWLADFLDPYDCTVINQAQNGQSFAGLKSAIDGSTFTVAEADYYILFLGTNYEDSWGYTTGSSPLRPAVTTVTQAIKNANPDARYFFVSPLKKWLDNTATLLNPLCTMRSFLEKWFAEYGFTVISGYNIGELSSLTKSVYMTDGIHPTQAFSAILGQYILDGITSERSNVTDAQRTKRQFTNTLSASSIVELDYNEDLTIDFKLNVNSWSATTGDWVDVCDLPTFLDDNVAPLITYGVCGGTTHQYRVSGGKLQIYFFTAPDPAFWDGGKFVISFEVND